MKKSLVKVSSPGKIILSGEHAVVYGYPALTTTIDKRCHITYQGNLSTKQFQHQITQAKDLSDLLTKIKKLSEVKSLMIDSKIPAGRGMGSSAAISVALATIYQLIQRKEERENREQEDQEKQNKQEKSAALILEQVNRLAYRLEKLQHGNPSGADNTVVTYGGCLWFRKELPDFILHRSITPPRPPENLFLLDSGKPVESTGQMVALVAENRQRRPRRHQHLFNQIEAVTRSFLAWLQNQESADLAEIIKENNRLLIELGVVSSTTQELITSIEKLGGAAKISGAGGASKGSGFLVVYHQDKNKLKEELDSDKNSYQLETLSIGSIGVSIDD